MTKVKQSTAKRSGSASIASKEQKASEGKATILATKNGQERTFAKNIWDHLPEDKQGWKEVAEKPGDVKTSKGTKKLTDEELLAEAKKAAITAYVAKFGKEPEDGMSIQEIGEALEGADDDDDDDDDDENMVDHVITQEDLDLDAELARSGKKVGETIRVAKPIGGNE